MPAMSRIDHDDCWDREFQPIPSARIHGGTDKDTPAIEAFGRHTDPDFGTTPRIETIEWRDGTWRRAENRDAVRQTTTESTAEGLKFQFTAVLAKIWRGLN